jgi:hypothetical protein
MCARHTALFSTFFAASLFTCVSSRADVITDWDMRASAVASSAALGQREAAIVDIAMFDAVNSVTPVYRPYRVRAPLNGPTSPVAAAASAAATALAALHPQQAETFKADLQKYLLTIPGPLDEINRGVDLGKLVAERIVEGRANDGATGSDIYRPQTQPGQYVPTANMVGSTWPAMQPFVLHRSEQFRPGPPVRLASFQWAADYNEVKSLGARNSETRSAAQTETARFWLMTGPQAYHPLARQIIRARNMKLVDSARFMAMFASALTDAYIAVYEAKYHHELWRPLTAIRNADLDGNHATEIDATWLPLDNTPLHPEYPCAHCVLSSTAATVMDKVIGKENIPELSLTSSTAPGVTHRFFDSEDLVREVSNARIWAGFHYRFSARVGESMGRRVGKYVVTHFAPLERKHR